MVGTTALEPGDYDICSDSGRYSRNHKISPLYMHGISKLGTFPLPALLQVRLTYTFLYIMDPESQPSANLSVFFSGFDFKGAITKNVITKARLRLKGCGKNTKIQNLHVYIDPC